MNPSTLASIWNADVIDEQYSRWLKDPDSLEPLWRSFFEGYNLAASQKLISATPQDCMQIGAKQWLFTGMIYAYRSLGHTQARINPLRDPVPNPALSLDRLGFTEAELNDTYRTGNYMGDRLMGVGELRKRLEETYCGPIGIEYLHIQETAQRRWLQARMEPILNRPAYTDAVHHPLLDRIVEAETFERFLHENFVGQKRFSIEGGEATLAALEHLARLCPSHGVRGIVMGMAHRGRLTVLQGIFNKSAEYIFNEFNDNYLPDSVYGNGDVKYHLGYTNTMKTPDGEVFLTLTANPSHLEAVDPVVEGRARALQRRYEDTEDRTSVVPVLIHGDAAFAGQGIVAETLNLSQLEGYRTGGTVHIVINNQIGFTTEPKDSRSTPYCTDVAKMLEAPIFHVNGDDPAAVAWTTELAISFRQQFHKDVVIDIYCYRRMGHNETDEPAFTQPNLYKKINVHPHVSEVYAERLVAEGMLTVADRDAMIQRHKARFEAAFARVRAAQEGKGPAVQSTFEGAQVHVQPSYDFAPVDTAVPATQLSELIGCLTTWPADFRINPKIQRQLEAKKKAFEGDSGLDWGTAEQLAWGTLLREGHPVRISGQDVTRGTFSHRHATFFDTETRERYSPLKNIGPGSARICIHNSSLSEAAILGFDYGYSLDYPEMLIIWEAQFGDFANGAQAIIDQFIASSESKWQRISNIVMLLPHGLEGQGPEHSSARLERFLQLCAEDNIQVCNFTTPAQYFHALRRQMHRPFRKPLVVMSPKSLLRHKSCVSRIADFTDDGFHTVLGDPTAKPRDVRRIILCSGKVYYDLDEHRQARGHKDTAIIRIEQLYPFDAKALADILAPYAKATDLVWCQEEPRNMGAWTFIDPLLEEVANRRPRYAGRIAAASPAVGCIARHRLQQAELVQRAFGEG